MGFRERLLTIKTILIIILVLAGITIGLFIMPAIIGIAAIKSKIEIMIQGLGKELK